MKPALFYLVLYLKCAGPDDLLLENMFLHSSKVIIGDPLMFMTFSGVLKLLGCDRFHNNLGGGHRITVLSVDPRVLFVFF